MKKLLTICCLFLLCLPACNKEGPIVPKPGQGSTGVVRPIGEPFGTPVEEMIGPQGGSLTSADGNLTVDIPSGALTSPVNVSIEMITRTLVDVPENASRTAYRLTPHGQQFSKPVKLTFRFADEEFESRTPALSGIAYQDDKGKWKGMGKVQVNEQAKTVSVETNHFSDWTTYETIFLTPKADFSVQVNSSATIRVMSVMPLGLLPTDEYMDKEEYFLEEPETINLPVDWRIVNGPGNGTITGVPTVSSAIFKAPATVPISNNPAMVEAKLNLKRHGTMFLFRHITIVDKIKPGIHLQINGGAWIHFDTELFTNGTSIRDDGSYPYDRHEIALTINGGRAKGEGTWAWSNPVSNEDQTTFEYIVKNPAPYTVYEPFYYAPCPRSEKFTSPGYVRIIEYQKNATGDNWVIGEFLIERLEPFIENVNCHNNAYRIQGYFKLKFG
jgi:hypothetical protein